MEVLKNGVDVSADNFPKEIIKYVNLMKQKAEKIYGKGDQNIIIQRVNFIKECKPRFERINGTKYEIQIPTDSYDNYQKAKYEIAHEVVHSLRPCLEKEVNYLEEGMSVYFQIKTSNYGNNLDIIKNEYPNYYKAYSEFKKLFKSDNKFVKKLQNLNKRFCDLTLEDFETVKISYPKDKIEELLKKFN